MEFTQKDIEQIQALGKQPQEVKEQLERFKTGFPDLELCNNVSVNNGLVELSSEDLKNYIGKYEANSAVKNLVKFVPASGAASRMFKMLFNYIEGSVTLDDEGAKQFFTDIKKFAFADELLSLVDEDEICNMVKNGDKSLVEGLLLEKGLNYGTLPKALLTFHKYSDGKVTKAIDEHLIEGAQYCAGENGKVKLHFTVSDNHMSLIKDHLQKVVPVFEKRFDKTYEISFSVQDKATDTPAVDMQNNPFRTDDGELLFRPGGHGALLKNLDAIDADVIFIKNIDNVAAQWLIADTLNYKKALGGILLDVQKQVFDYCRKLEDADELDTVLETEIVSFLNDKLGLKVADDFAGKGAAEKVAYLFEKLNRPIRICGVVKSSNTGGGPFWVKDKAGSESLQLVETAQINLGNDAQKNILQSSQYANITDLVCGVKDYKGNKFDLMQYRDADTGFIAEKSQGAKTLKAMELPGLWNGAMSNWNTAFVQVPITTFNPVKTVLDLLKKEHQGQN